MYPLHHSIDCTQATATTKRQFEEPTSKSSKRLRFSPTSELIVTDPKTTRDRQSAWYSKAQINEFKQGARQTALSYRETRTSKLIKCIAISAITGSPPVEIQVRGAEHIRGLEHMISLDVLKVLLDRRRSTIRAVLECQKEMRDAGIRVDPSRIAFVSEANSLFTREWYSRLIAFHQNQAP